MCSLLLAALVISYGIAAQRLSPGGTGLVAAIGLVLVIFSLTRTGRAGRAPAAVGACIGAA